ncbi:MAG TPA: LysR substrate-binding domain-containing protein [Puia sp.]|jgi:LysR family hydrogen peroxide-inducible transcriptional activator|nr:LysR substrate-binding domain-containing protein [Puia sp.]
MTFVQLEYIVAIDTYRHFATAAGHCFVTQPTLSMQVRKLEAELGLKIFDRSKQPVIPTEAGREIIEQARKILGEKQLIGEIVQTKKGVLTGEIRVGIIPTLAPYLLPLFVQSFTSKYPQVKLIVNELMTDLVVARLREGRIDAGILVTPLQEAGIREQVLFYEELLVYISRKNAAYKKTYMLARDIDPDKLWLLEEGHCFRSQIIRLCELRKASKEGSHFDYEAGSLETLRRMVELNDGITILPELAVQDMTGKQQRLIRRFRRPAPMREVSLVVHRDFVKQRLVQALHQEILKAVPEKVRQNKNHNVVLVQ